MNLLHLSDLHLGAKCGRMEGRAADRRADLLRAFDFAVDRALGGAGGDPVDLVLVTGDLFDVHAPEASLVSHVGNALDRLSAAGVPVALLPGTHDGYGYPDSVYRKLALPPGVRLLASPVLEPGPVLDCRGTPVHLYGIAYDPARTRNPWGAFRRREEGGIHVALVHGSLEGNPEWEMRNRDLPIPLSAIRESGMDYVALGHYHDFHEGREGGTVWCYPGTLEGLKWGEWGERFLVSVSIEPSAAAGAPRVRVVKTPYPGRRIVECDLDLDRTGIATADALAKEILARATEAAPSPSGPRAPGDLIVRVVLRGTRPAAIDLGRLRARLADELFHVAFDDRLRSHDPAIRELARSERTVRGIFVRRMEERLEGAADEAARARLELALRLGLEALEEEEGTLPAPDPAAARAGPGPGGPRAH